MPTAEPVAVTPLDSLLAACDLHERGELVGATAAGAAATQPDSSVVAGSSPTAPVTPPKPRRRKT